MLLAVWWSGVALVLLVRSLWYVVAEELGWASFPSPQSSPQRGEGVDPVLLAVFVIWRCFGAVSPEPLVCVVARHLVGSLPLTPALSPKGRGVDPVLLAVWWSGVALVQSVRSLWYVVAEELGWASFPSPSPLPKRGEGVDSVLLMVFWSGVAFVSQALRVRYAAHGNARAASMSRPPSPRRTGPLSLRERARVRGKWSAKTTVLKPPRSPPPVGRRAPGSRVAHGCPSPPRRPER